MQMQDVANWLTKNKINACEIEDKLNYACEKITCNKDCAKCLKKYLSIDLDRYKYVQLSLF